MQVKIAAPRVTTAACSHWLGPLWRSRATDRLSREPSSRTQDRTEWPLCRLSRAPVGSSSCVSAGSIVAPSLLAPRSRVRAPSSLDGIPDGNPHDPGERRPQATNTGTRSPTDDPAAGFPQGFARGARRGWPHARTNPRAGRPAARRHGPGLRGREHPGHHPLPRVARRLVGGAVLAPEGLHAGVHDRARLHGADQAGVRPPRRQAAQPVGRPAQPPRRLGRRHRGDPGPCAQLPDDRRRGLRRLQALRDAARRYVGRPARAHAGRQPDRAQRLRRRARQAGSS